MRSDVEKPSDRTSEMPESPAMPALMPMPVPMLERAEPKLDTLPRRLSTSAPMPFMPEEA